MNTIEAAARQVDLLQEHERAMGRLYAAYAHRFPRDRDFWLSLSREEEEHAHWIESLQGQMEQEPFILIVNRFPIEAIHHSINYINNLIDRVDRPDLTPIKALSTALDIERALLENRYFEVFAGDRAEVRHILQSLAQGAAAHLERVHRAWCDRQRPPGAAPSAPGAR